MKTSCPHCSQHIDIDGETLAFLQGSFHFACPACSGAVPVPPLSGSHPLAPLRDEPPDEITEPPSTSTTRAHAHRGLNRNLLILGSATLLVLGGLAFFIASRKSGDTHLTKQNIANEIINNAYFQQLIAAGKTTEKDLAAIEIIRPYGDGFIGIGKEALDWNQSLELARKTGGAILDPGLGGATERDALLAWLAEHLAQPLTAPVWIQESGRARVLDGREILAVTGTDRPRKALIHWLPGSDGNGTAGAPKASISAADPWRDFDPGPLVFEDSLTTSKAEERLNIIQGQYSWGIGLIPGVGFKIKPGHTSSVAWSGGVLGDSCRVDFEAQIPQDEELRWLMKGSGLGNNPDTGIAFSIRGDELSIQRDEKTWLRKKIPTPLEPERWVSVQTDMRDGHLAVRLDGTLIAEASAQETMGGPLHSWFGMTGHAIYRNLRIHSSEKNQSLQPRFAPSPGIPPRPNGEEIFTFSEPDGPLGAGWQVHDSEKVTVERGALLLYSGSNRLPHAMIAQPFTGAFAVEFTFRYPIPHSHNLMVSLSRAPEPPLTQAHTGESWHVHLPSGSGRYELRWSKQIGSSDPASNASLAFRDHASEVAKTVFHAPLLNRDYRARIEAVGESIRVFLDGNLLMEGKRPSESALSDSPTFIGFGQFYSSTRIDSLSVYRLSGE